MSMIIKFRFKSTRYCIGAGVLDMHASLGAERSEAGTCIPSAGLGAETRGRAGGSVRFWSRGGSFVVQQRRTGMDEGVSSGTAVCRAESSEGVVLGSEKAKKVFARGKNSDGVVWLETEQYMRNVWGTVAGRTLPVPDWVPFIFAGKKWLGEPMR
ncbi:hypothetical protein LX32DRAFT_402398 [Colletotrichum zoysiae]|uniref:Uncharacterized protein n=1 Tax=Colletotrichum zoysiae TaxID=1216348 RepID=A0AAD9HI40_9PEZI|nr:hypothetical protein LX32DRAFT_402398 [Colletotrichum zoysiae]